MPPRLLIFDDDESLNSIAVEMLVYLARTAITERDQFTLALSGGGTPQRLFELLAHADYTEQISWPHTHIFWGDERCIPPDQEGSNYKQADDAFLSKVPIPAENIHRIRGELPPEQAAEDYTRQLREFVEQEKPDRSSEDLSGLCPHFDLVLLGMGSDGHTASLFPGPITDRERTTPTLSVTAHYQDRPANRVSLTPLVFNAAQNVFFLVTGAGKAETLEAVLNGPDDPERLPAQRIQPTEGQVTWFVDQEAAMLLK
jgi:6-phosphogluconolactonase